MTDNLKKSEILIDGNKYTIDGIWWDYPQTDSESSGATDDNVMYRDVLPRRMKVGFIFKSPSEEIASSILNERKKKQSEVNYYDLEARERITRIMYPVADQITANSLFEENGEEEFTCDDIEIRFIQMIPDEFTDVSTE